MNRKHLNRTELRRDLKSVDAANRAAMPRWRETLDRVFSGEERLTTDQKAELLGVPTRRHFFKVGGTVIAGAALLAACGDDTDEAATGTTGGSDSSDTTAANGDGSMDLVLANTAISLEILAVDTYQAAIDSGLVTNADYGAAAMLFQSHHEEHKGALEGVVNGAGATPYAEANAAVKAAIVDPVLTADDLDEAKILKLAYDLEAAAAQTYVFAATQLSTPALRSTIMTIGGIENRHATILGTLLELGNDQVHPAFLKSENPLPAEAVITG